MLNPNDTQNLIGSQVYDNSGEKVGKVAQVYLSNSDGQVEWLTVSTGLFGMKESFVPARDASFDGGEIRVGVDKDQIKGAPQIEGDDEIGGNEESELYRYYSLDGDVSTQTTTDTVTTGTATTGTVNEHGTEGYDTSGPTTDDAMTRSEERLEVGTQTREAGRARLRKYVTTEQQTVSVPVSREEVRVEREPITDANVGDALEGPEISEEEHEVVLHAEEAVVDKKTVPVERVSLGTETVTGTQQVQGEVREEHIEVDGVDSTTTGTTDGDVRTDR
jgi:uncharacterized protein (TIGR02271 family)